MLVDENGIFISQRKYPQLALIELSEVGQTFHFNSPSQTSLVVAEDSFTGNSIATEVWGDACAGFVAEQPVNQWFSDYLKQPVRLVKYNHGKARPSDPIFSKDGDIVSYADGFPLLVISEASLNDLNSKLEQQNVSHVSMTNFRPNLVVAGTTAFEEDQWKKIKIGEVEFDCVKLCSRCVLTTVNPNSGIKSENREPLKTLASYRKMSGGVMFGMNMIPRNSGVIRLGDTLEVLD
jgi:uncharacterized protein YcbX